MSAIGTQIADSINAEPDRWTFHCITMKRDDGLAVDIIRPFHGGRNYARVIAPERDNPELGWWDWSRIQRAFRKWQLRRLEIPS